MKDKSRLWDASLIMGGLLFAGITLQKYRSYDSPKGLPEKFKLSAREASNSAESIQTYLQSHTEDFNAWSRLGIAHFYSGPDHYADGLNAIDRARSLGATSETLFYYAGVMYEALGLPEYALHELSKYLRHYPKDFETQVRVANLYSKQGKWDEAFRLYEALTERWSKDPVLWFNFGVVCKEKGELDKALTAFSHVHALGGTLPSGLYYHEAEIARLKGDLDTALGLFQKEIELHPQFLPAFIGLESIQRKKNLWKDARETRSKIAELKSAAAAPSH